MTVLTIGQDCLALTLRRSQPQTLDELLASYGRHNDVRASTLEQKRITVRLFGRYLARDATLEDLNRQAVVEFLNWYRVRVEPATAAAKRQHLLTLWGFAFDEQLVGQPPWRIKRIRIPEKVPEGWVLEELRAILDQCDRLGPSHCDPCRGEFRPGVPRGKFLRAFALGYLSTGLRLTAQLSVRRRDVRRDRTFTVRWREQKTWCEESKQFTVEAWAAITAMGEHEFCYPYGRTKAERRRIRTWWKRALRAAGLDDSRGTFAQQLRRTAASYKELQQPGSARKFLGHKTAGLAEKRYLVPRIVSPGLVSGPVLDL